MIDVDAIMDRVFAQQEEPEIGVDLNAILDRVLIEPRPPWVVFASGLTRGQFWGFAELGYGVGFSLAECKTEKCLGPTLVELVRMLHTPYAGAPVLVDSGAVAEIDPKTCRLKEGQKPIGPRAWDHRMDQYLEIATALGATAWLIAPDKVCDQRTSIKRFERQVPRLRKMAKLGAVIVLPLQPGPLSLFDLDRRLSKMLRVSRRPCAVYPGSQVIPAVPMRRAGKGTITPLSDLLVYLRQRKPPAIHLLGMGPNNRLLSSVLVAIERAVPGIRVSIDAALVRPKAHPGKPWIDLKPQVYAEVVSDWRSPLEQLDFTEIVGYMEAAELAEVARSAGAPQGVARQIGRSADPQEQFGRLWNLDEDDPWFGLVDDRLLQVLLERAYVLAVPKFGEGFSAARSDPLVSQRDRRLVHRIFPRLT